MKTLKKALSLSLALVLALALAVPAFAAPVTVPIKYYGDAELSDATKTGKTIRVWDNYGTPDLDVYNIPVGSSLTVRNFTGFEFYVCPLSEHTPSGMWRPDEIFSSLEYAGVTKMESNKQGVYRDITITFGEGTAEGYWVLMAGEEGASAKLVVCVGGSSATQPTTPTEPTTPAQPEKPAGTKTANPTNDKLEVNGAAQNPTVYKIGGSNYFKIRDVAAVLNGTEKQFAVGYSGGKVTVTSGQPYEATGKELAGAPAAAKDASPSNDAIVIDGVETSLTVYKIGGSNYFKLRDLGKALDFNVGYSGGQVTIDTSKSYS